MEATQNPSSENAGITTSSALERMRIQAAQNPDVMYRAFDSYPWVKDPNFQSLLATELLAQSELSPAEIALQCRIKRYEGRIGIKIDPEQYRTYRSEGERPKVNLVPQVIIDQEALYEPDVSKRKYAAVANGAPLEKPDGIDQVQSEGHDDPNVPTWQRAAPKATLFVDKNEGGNTENSGKVPYPKKFEDIIEFLQSGKEIPGILKIPDTVIDDPSISTTTGRTAPLKPWERRVVPEDKAS